MGAQKPSSTPVFSIIIPCYNEESSVEDTIRHIVDSVGSESQYEIVAVNDGSTDLTAQRLTALAESNPALQVIHHNKNRGYGAALKTGIQYSIADLIVITDADGTYPNEKIPELVMECQHQDMVVGARIAAGVKYSRVRKIPKIFLRRWASWIADQEIPDINSGLRVFRREAAETYLTILPNTFSFTTTITLAMLTTYRRVKFVPITYHPRVGKSKIKPIRDTLRFIMLILRTGTYFAPLRTFSPFILFLFSAAAVSLAYDVFKLNNLTDKTVLLFLFSFNTGMFALLADMIDKRSPR